jgi:hypothetical protein
MVNTGATVLVAYGFVSLVVPGEQAPTSHRNPISHSYYSVRMDRVINDYKKLALDFPRVDVEKTLGQAEHLCIAWPRATSLFLVWQMGHHRLLLNYLMIGADESE